MFERGEEKLAWSVAYAVVKWLVYDGGVSPTEGGGFASPSGVGQAEFEIFNLLGWLMQLLDQTSDGLKVLI